MSLSANMSLDMTVNITARDQATGSDLNKLNTLFTAIQQINDSVGVNQVYTLNTTANTVNDQTIVSFLPTGEYYYQMPPTDTFQKKKGAYYAAPFLTDSVVFAVQVPDINNVAVMIGITNMPESIAFDPSIRITLARTNETTLDSNINIVTDAGFNNDNTAFTEAAGDYSIYVKITQEQNAWEFRVYDDAALTNLVHYVTGINPAPSDNWYYRVIYNDTGSTTADTFDVAISAGEGV